MTEEESENTKDSRRRKMEVNERVRRKLKLCNVAHSKGKITKFHEISLYRFRHSRFLKTSTNVIFPYRQTTHELPF